MVPNNTNHSPSCTLFADNTPSSNVNTAKPRPTNIGQHRLNSHCTPLGVNFLDAYYGLEQQTVPSYSSNSSLNREH